LSDVWVIPVSSGGDGHGAQFPLALPGRCIAISTDPNDVVLDPFIGSGNTAVAALSLGRRVLGVDVSRQYLDVAESKIRELEQRLPIEVPIAAASNEANHEERKPQRKSS
jgi:DNA modification methylase